MEAGKVFPASQARSLLNPARRLVQSPKRTVAAMDLAADATVLELGCGPGFFSPWIVRATDRGFAVLTDLQAEMLEVASGRLRDATNASYVQADAAVLPFADATFDAVFLATVLGEVPDPSACIAEIRRVLRASGTLAVGETRRDSDFIPLSRLRPLVEQQGFGFLDRHGVGWQYVARFRREP